MTLVSEVRNSAWIQVSNPDGRLYYWNTKTDETSWDKPKEDIISPPSPSEEVKKEDEPPSLSIKNNTKQQPSSEKHLSYNSTATITSEYSVDCQSNINNSDWECHTNEEGQSYWFNKTTKKTNWCSPELCSTNSPRQLTPIKKMSQLKIDVETEENNNNTRPILKHTRSASATPISTSETVLIPDISETPKTNNNNNTYMSPLRSDDTQYSSSNNNKRKSRIFKTPKNPFFFHTSTTTTSINLEKEKEKENIEKGWRERMKEYIKDNGPEKGIKYFVNELEIGKPFDVLHTVKVKFDAEQVKYDGLPIEWKEAQQQFGVSLNSCPRVVVTGYTDRIPAVLVFLKRSLFELKGEYTEGIFRISPDSIYCSAVKQKINSGYGTKAVQFNNKGENENGNGDAHVVANLIKQFFRELKPNLLNCLSREQVMEMASLNEFALQGEQETEEKMFLLNSQYLEKVMFLREPERSTFLYLLDLLSDVVEKEKVNRMTAKNLAIVMSPNLFNSENQTPMEALVLSQKTAALVTRFLLWTLWRRRNILSVEQEEQRV